MVPRRVIVLRALPLTPNGKINRQGLPDPFQEPEAEAEKQGADGADSESDIVRVLSDTERGLLEIFAKLLGASPLKIQLDDDFFELGGHSLLATQAIFHISQKLHVHLPINLLFQSPTITALAKYASRLRHTRHTRHTAC
jgi:acyl carrier protein